MVVFSLGMEHDVEIEQLRQRGMKEIYENLSKIESNGERELSRRRLEKFDEM